MKVNLAAQLLSASTASALEYLRSNQYDGFEDSLGTEIFISHIDRLFDILNSRSIFGKGFKAPICMSNMQAKVTALSDTCQFLLSLCDSNGKKVTETKRRMCILGFIASIDAIIFLSERLLTTVNGINGVQLRYLLTHKLSQDHVEMFFSTIRRRGGWNNNPTALQFAIAYRSILSRVGAVPSDNGNVHISVCNDVPDAIPSVSQDWSASGDSQCDDADTVESIEVDEMTLPLLSEFVENVCVYIAGFVIRRVVPKVQCTDCRKLLSDPPVMNSCQLLILKDNGGLITPSQGVVKIVEQAEKYIRHLVPADSSAYAISRLGLQLESTVLENVDPVAIFGHSVHGFETADGIDNHLFLLTRLVVRAYTKLRKYHMLRSWNIKQQGKVVRQTLTKAVLFRNQQIHCLLVITVKNC